MDNQALIITLAVITIGPFTSVYLAHMVMRNKDDQHSITFETRRMFFAAAVLVGIGFVFFEGMILYYFGDPNNQNGKEIFDTCKTVIPPIVTLILGYYFGSTTNNNDNKK